MVELDPCRPLRLGLEPVLVRLLGERGEERRVALPYLSLVRVLQALARVLADRLQHQEAVVGDRLQEARVDEGSEAVEIGLADLLGRVEREAAREDGETRRRAPALAASSRS